MGAGDAPALALCGVFGLAAFGLLWRLGAADLHFDEPLYGRDGWHAIHARAPVADHPVFGKYLIGLGQLLVGRTPVGMRLLPALVALGGTFFAYGLGRRASRWAGVLAAFLWATFARDLVVAGGSTIDTRIDRYALLDTIATPLQLGAVWAALRWGDRPSRGRAATVGLLVGLAVATKLSAGVVVPVVAGALLLPRAPRRDVITGAATAAATAAGTFLLTYLPFGREAPALLRGAIDFQLDHAELGHIQALGDQVYLREPWWANARFWWDADGLLVLVVLAAALAAWWARDRGVVAACWAGAVLVFAALAWSPVALSHYRVQWLGYLLVLSAIGVASLWAVGRSWSRAVALVLGVVLVGAGLVGTARVATLQEGPYHQMVDDIRASGEQPEVAVTYGTDVAAYLPGTESVFGAFAPPALEPDLLVIERQFAVTQITAERLDAWRATARRIGLTPRVRGDLEYWYRAT